LIGVALIVCGLVTLVSLFDRDSSGVLGRYVAAGMLVSVGVGAYIIPFLFMLAGAMMIVGPLEIIPRNIAVGSTTLFLVITGIRSLATGMRPTGAGLAEGGGWIGNAIANSLCAVAGITISYIILAGAAVVAVILIVDVPLALLIDRIRESWANWRAASRDRAEAVRLARSDRIDSKKSLAKTKEPAPVVVESRKRTLASIFGKSGGSGEEEGSDESPVAVAERPQVRINGGAGVSVPVAPTNGGAGLDLAPVEQAEFRLPPTSLLAEPPPPPPRVESELRENIEVIERTLEEFKVQANVVEIAVGPTVARYEIRLAPGIKVNKIVGLADNLAMQLAAIDVRVEAPIPGKAAIGVEVPNKHRATVVLREIVESKPFAEASSKLTVALGKDVSGQPLVADLGRMPHMLVGGATNAGKSICLNTLIGSLLFRATPDELKMILIDPKRVELSLFDGIPHLACPVVKDVKQAAGILRAAVQEMEGRYGLLSRVGAKNIDGYNEKVGVGERMPYIVIVVDELCDLMMQCAAEVEGSITRLAQLARAVGIHLVIATQRPSVDVITGVIKANIPSRIAFAVSSHHDSRTILDQNGAERLIGRGDMLFLPIDASKPARIQGCFMSEREIERLCEFLKEQRKPIYTMQPVSVGGGGGMNGEDDEAFADEFYEPSVRFVVNTGYCSTSMLQRKFKIGYTRAARIVDAMEQQGVVGPLDGAKPRQVLIGKGDVEGLFSGQGGLRFQPEPDGDFEEDVPPAEIIEPDQEDEEEDE